jgi:hypothetical protein
MKRLAVVGFPFDGNSTGLRKNYERVGGQDPEPQEVSVLSSTYRWRRHEERRGVSFASHRGLVSVTRKQGVKKC